MGRKSDISTTQVAQICALRQAGFTERQIASQLSISPSSVHKCFVRTIKTGTYQARKRPPRHRVTDTRTDRVMRRIVTANPTASASFI